MSMQRKCCSNADATLQVEIILVFDLDWKSGGATCGFHSWSLFIDKRIEHKLNSLDYLIISRDFDIKVLITAISPEINTAIQKISAQY